MITVVMNLQVFINQCMMNNIMKKCLLIDGRSVCCGFAVSKNIKSLGMNIKYLGKKTSSFTHINKQYNFVYV